MMAISNISVNLLILYLKEHFDEIWDQENNEKI